MDQSPNSLKFGFGLEYSLVKKYLIYSDIITLENTFLPNHMKHSFLHIIKNNF